MIADMWLLVLECITYICTH